MGRFDPKYTEEQCEAIVSAVLDQGMSAPAACKAAKAGQLLPESFDFSVGTARDYARKERNKRSGRAADGKGTIEERLDAAGERAMGMIEHRLSHLDRKQKRKRKLDSTDLEELRKTLSAARELRALTKGIAPAKGGSAERRAKAEAAAQSPHPTDPGSALVRRMEREAGSGAKPSAAQSVGNGSTAKHAQP